MSEEKKIKLSDQDWENLVPIIEIPIASQKVSIRPLGFKKLTETIRKFQNSQKELLESGVTLENYSSPEGMLAITTIILERMPDIISDSSNIDLTDVERLPINVALTLVEAILDANITSQKGFLKNLTALATKAAQLMGTQAKA